MSTTGTDRAPTHPEAGELRLVEILSALSDPVRLRIVSRLAGAGCELSCSAFDLPVSKSTSTHHFRVLREAGLVRQRYAGTARLNALRREELDAAFPGVLDAVLAAAAAADAARGVDGVHHPAGA
jgi:DNA-binding transcriptional ArsR family regulator